MEGALSGAPNFLSESSLRSRTKSFLIESIFKNKNSKEWHVLVVDYHSMRILSAALSMYDILMEGVCLVDSIEDSDREALPHLSAIYFLSPCALSFSTLIEDFSTKPPRYAKSYVYTTSTIPRDVFYSLKDTQAASYIHALKEVNVEFLAQESHIFQFDMREGFVLCYDESMEEVKDPFQRELAERIATVFSVLDVLPSTIRHSPSLSKLATYCRRAFENLSQRPESGCRLLILDRTFDLVSPLLHEFTYQAMIEDLLDQEVVDSEFKQTYYNSLGEQTQRVTLLDERDPVYYVIRHKHMAEVIQWLVSSVNNFIRTNNIGQQEQDASNLGNIADMMRTLPKYKELGTKYSTHLDLVNLLMRDFRSRKISEVAAIQQTLATGHDTSGKSVKLSQLAEKFKYLLDDGSIPRSSLLKTILLFAQKKNFKISEVEELLELGDFGGDELRSCKNIRNLTPDENTSSLLNFPGFSSKSKVKRKTEVEYELSRWTPVLKSILEDLANNKLKIDLYPKITIDEAENFAPKANQWSQKPSSSPTNRQNFSKYSKTIVFILGGMTYSEIRTVYKLMEANFKNEIILGSTHIIKSKEFLADIGF